MKKKDKPRKPYCHYDWDQIKSSGMLSDERTTEIDAIIESRIHPVFLHTGKEVPGPKFFDYGNGKGVLMPEMDHDPDFKYGKRLLLPHILTPEELDDVNSNWFSAHSLKMESDRYEKAEKLTDWAGGVFHGDTFYPSLDEALETIWSVDGEDLPEYLWTSTPSPVVSGADASRVASDFIENNGWEDMEVDDLEGVGELHKAMKAFEEANKDVLVYRPDYRKLVLISEERKKVFTKEDPEPCQTSS